MHRRQKVAVVIALFGGVAFATLETAHLRGFVLEMLPRQYVFLLPIATVVAFSLALYLSHAKYPQVILSGILAPLGTQGNEQQGLFVANVGDAPALNILLEPLGSSTFTASFDPVPFVKVSGDRERVTIRLGQSVKDMFDVSAYLQGMHVFGLGPGRKVDPASHPIRFTYEDAHGREYSNEEFELGLVNTVGAIAPIDLRLTIRRRPRDRRTIRHRLGALLVRIAARLL